MYLAFTSSVFRVLHKPVLLEPEKSQLVATTVACLHDFLRRSSDSAAIYTPPGTFDYEENGRVIEGSCRAMSNENKTYLFIYFLLERLQVSQL